MKKIRFLFIMLSVVLSIVLIALVLPVGCTTTTESKEIKIMFVNPWPSLPFWATGSEGANDAAKKLAPLGVSFSEQGTDEGYSNASLVINIIETAIQQKFNGIICHPYIPETFVPVINKAVDSGIYVVCVADDAPKSKRSAALSTDDIGAGKGAGEALVKAMGDKPIKVAILSSTPGVAQLDNRIKGFQEAIVAAKGTVVAIEYGYSDPTQNLAKVEALLLANPDINAFFGAGADHAPSIVQVLEEKGKTGEVTVVGFDDDPNTIKAIENGSCYATVVQRQYLWGYGGVVYAYALNKGVKLPAFTDTGFQIVTKDTVGNFAELTRDTKMFDDLIK